MLKSVDHRGWVCATVELHRRHDLALEGLAVHVDRDDVRGRDGASHRLARIDEDVIGARDAAAHVAVEVDHLRTLEHAKGVGKRLAQLAHGALPGA
jgi:hypothetical protein